MFSCEFFKISQNLRNKFNPLKELVLIYEGIPVFTETKLDDSFMTSQFLVNEFSEPFKIDRNRTGRGVMKRYFQTTFPVNYS